MTTLNQTGHPDVMFRRSEMIQWAIALIQSFTLILAALAANAQTNPVATGTNISVSAAEVTAFMQSFQKDPGASFKISTNPKRVLLLLAAIQQEPAGPWVQFLQGFCESPTADHQQNGFLCMHPANHRALGAVVGHGFVQGKCGG
jgi:hypothetical protein